MLKNVWFICLLVWFGCTSGAPEDKRVRSNNTSEDFKEDHNVWELRRIGPANLTQMFEVKIIFELVPGPSANKFDSIDSYEAELQCEDGYQHKFSKSPFLIGGRSTCIIALKKVVMRGVPFMVSEKAGPDAFETEGRIKFSNSSGIYFFVDVDQQLNMRPGDREAKALFSVNAI